jgi:hypothetical protein
LPIIALSPTYKLELILIFDPMTKLVPINTFAPIPLPSPFNMIGVQLLVFVLPPIQGILFIEPMTTLFKLDEPPNLPATQFVVLLPEP